MSLIKSFVEQINNEVMGFDSSIKVYNELTRLQEQQGEQLTTTTPVYDVGDGSSEKVVLDDTYPMQVYHRIKESIIPENDPESGYGRKTETRYNIPMRMVVMGQLEMFPAMSDFGESLSLEFANRLNGNFIPTETNIRRMFLNVDEINTDKIDVIEDEFTNHPVMEKLGTIFIFAIDYSIDLWACENIVCQ